MLKISLTQRAIILAVILTISIILSILSRESDLTVRNVEVSLEDGVISSIAVHLPRGEPVGGALLLHGFSGTKEQLSLLASSLAKAGFVVFTPDWRGHGTSGGTLSGQNDTVLRDVKAFTRELRSTYNLSFSVVGGHSMGGAFAQLASSELHPRNLIIISSRAVPDALVSSLTNGARALFIAASLDTVVSPSSIRESLSLITDSQVGFGTVCNVGKGGFKATLIGGPDHLTVLFSEALTREALMFLGLETGVSYALVVTVPLLAAALWVVCLTLASSIPLFGPSQYQLSSSPMVGSCLRLLSPYLLAGLLHPLLSFAGFLVPGLGTSSFFTMLFLSLVITIGIMVKLRVIRIKVLRPPYGMGALAWGTLLGLGLAVGLHLILGVKMIRLVPSVYSLPTIFLTLPVAAAFSILDSSVVDALASSIPRWVVGFGTKALSLASSLPLLALLSPQQAGFFIIFDYMILLILAPLYALESGLAKQGKSGRCASTMMLTAAISVLAAASGARLA